MNNQEESGCCCQPLTDENDELKKIKPILIGGIIIYTVLLFLDIFYLYDNNLITYLILILSLSFFTFNRCYILFQWFTIIAIFLIFETAIPGMGIRIQTGFKSPSLLEAVINFVIYFFILASTCFIFFFGFVAYKEMKYLFETRIAGNPSLIPSYMAANYQGGNGNNYGNNYNYYSGGNNRRNNNNDDDSEDNNKRKKSKPNKGFTPFSGKGYTVGGS